MPGRWIWTWNGTKLLGDRAEEVNLAELLANAVSEFDAASQTVNERAKRDACKHLGNRRRPVHSVHEVHRHSHPPLAAALAPLTPESASAAGGPPGERG